MLPPGAVEERVLPETACQRNTQAGYSFDFSSPKADRPQTDRE